MDRSAARALAWLAGLASPVFVAAAIVGWLRHLWPATPLTFAIAAVAVLAGPVLALAHLATVRDDEPAERPPAPAPPPPPRPARRPPAHARPAWAMTPARARSLAFLAWREQAPGYLRPLRSRARRRTVSAVRPESKHDHLA
jgi:hypothetical protein